jgi:hypothetical protein
MKKIFNYSLVVTLFILGACTQKQVTTKPNRKEKILSDQKIGEAFNHERKITSSGDTIETAEFKIRSVIMGKGYVAVVYRRFFYGATGEQHVYDEQIDSDWHMERIMCPATGLIWHYELSEVKHDSIYSVFYQEGDTANGGYTVPIINGKVQLQWATMGSHLHFFYDDMDKANTWIVKHQAQLQQMVDFTNETFLCKNRPRLQILSNYHSS